MRDVVQVLNPLFYLRQARTVFQFLAQPTLAQATHRGVEKWTVLFALFIVGEVLSILTVLPKALLEEFDVMIDLENMLSDLDWSTTKKLLVGAGLAVFIEEAAFRAHLRFKPTMAALTVAGLTYMTASLIEYGGMGLVNGLFNETVFMRAGIALGAGLLTWMIVRLPRIRTKLETFWTTHFRWIFWGMVVLFGLMHLDRYTNFTLATHALFIPIIVLPQFMSATMYGYVRVRYGFAIGLGMHALANGYLIALFG